MEQRYFETRWKSPRVTKTFTMNLKKFLAGRKLEELRGIIVTPPGVTVAAAAIDETKEKISIKLAGGEMGVKHLITAPFKMNTGDEDERSFWLVIGST